MSGLTKTPHYNNKLFRKVAYNEAFRVFWDFYS